MFRENLVSMEEVRLDDYFEFLKSFESVKIGGVEIPLSTKGSVDDYGPQDFELECTSVWSFPKRGTWATHKGNYRGNWAPELPRNILMRYSKPGDLVLDQMMGGGTTLVESKILSRNAVGVDVNPDAVMLSRSRLDFPFKTGQNLPETKQKTYKGDARNLDKIEDASIDLIATHPPYGNIISYSDKRISGDLSAIDDLSDYVEEMRKVADEAYRVLKPGKYCAVLMGDTRKNKHYVPVAQRVMERFLNAGFVLKEDIIKRQWRCKTTGFWVEKSRNHNFLLIMHEHLYIFRKPEDEEDARKYLF